MADYKVNSTILSCGGGFCNADYIVKAGKNSEYTLACAGWGKGVLEYKGDTAKSLNEQFKTITGMDLDEYGANGYLAAGVMINAVERAKSTEPQVICDALAATDIKPDDPALALHAYDGVKFGDVRGMHNQNIYAKDILTQVLDGQFVLVGPLSFVKDSKVVFPVPAWEDR